jgi:hypothetical protein
MKDSKLLELAKQQLKEGYSPNHVRKSLKAAGFEKVDIDAIAPLTFLKYALIIVGVLLFIFGVYLTYEIYNKPVVKMQVNQGKTPFQQELEFAPLMNLTPYDKYYCNMVDNSKKASCFKTLDCNNISKPEVKKSCLSVLKNNVTLCREVKDASAKSICLVELGIKNNNSMICSQERNEFVRFECEELIEEYFEGGLSRIDSEISLLSEKAKYNSAQYCIQAKKPITSECWAFHTKNPDLCDNMPAGTFIDWCKAKITKNSSYCVSMFNPNITAYSESADCLTDTAVTLKDCDDIDYGKYAGYEKDECIAFVTGNVSYCDRMIERKALYCRAQTLKNISYCYRLPFDRKWQCLAWFSEDPEICDRFHEAFCKEYYGVDITNKNS